MDMYTNLLNKTLLLPYYLSWLRTIGKMHDVLTKGGNVNASWEDEDVSEYMLPLTLTWNDKLYNKSKTVLSMTMLK